MSALFSFTEEFLGVYVSYMIAILSNGKQVVRGAVNLKF